VPGVVDPYVDTEGRMAPAWQVVVPVVAIAILGYTIDTQVTGQTFP